MRIGHSLIALIVAFVGGQLSRHFYARIENSFEDRSIHRLDLTWLGRLRRCLHKRGRLRCSHSVSVLAGIVIGYLLALFAATAGVVAFPFSTLVLGLLFVVVGVFFVVAIPVIVMAYLFLTITFSRAIMSLGRRLLFGADQDSESQRTGKPSLLQKDLETQGTDAGLWDRWIDGSW